MGYVLGSRSRLKLEGVHPKLVAVVERAIQLTTVDFMVTDGVRTDRQQMELYAKGRTAAELRRVGIPTSIYARPGDRKVTWTLNSRHKINSATGFGHAVDLVPYPVDWNDLSKFDAIAKAMFAAAKELKVKLRWGADWDSDGNKRERGESDSPHFEIV